MTKNDNPSTPHTSPRPTSRLHRKVGLLVAGVVLLLTLLGACAVVDTEGESPTVNVVHPEAGAVFGEDATVALEAVASDDGEVARVVFSVGDERLEDTAAPYQAAVEARDLGVGAHTLSVVAYDDAGASSVPAEVDFSVQQSPARRFEVTARVTGAGAISSEPAGIDCGSTCTATFAEGTDLTLRATPDSGNVFRGWGDACSGAASCDLTVTADTQVGATFEPAAPGAFAVTVTKSGPGTVTSSPAGISCGGSCSAEFDEGVTVTLAATPLGGATFEGWGGACGGEETCTLTEDAEVTALFKAEATGSISEAFTLVFLPDTQAYVCSGCRENNPDTDRWQPDIFRAQTQWIADNLETENIAFVANGGDIVDDASKLEEWQVADAAYATLDGKVPYSAVPGDHDYFPEEYRDGDTTYYRQFFGAERYRDYAWYGGSSPSGLSHYQRFEAGGQDFIQIGLEFEAPGPASDPNSTLGWAKAILEANPDTPTILSMHKYLKDSAERRSNAGDQEACYLPGSGVGSEPCRDKEGTLDPNASSGEEIFEELVAPYPQVFMVLSAHYYRSDEGPGEYHQVSTNDAGSNVYEMLADYQLYDNGGDGWLRLVELVPEGGEGGLDRIRVRTYSPTRDEFQPGAASNFSFDLDFAERFGMP